MRDLANMIWIETLKVRRSRLPIYTALGFLLMPLMDAFFMVILKDPDFARRAGLISAKAQLMAGTADWATFLQVLAQAVAVGGIFLFSLLGAWVFGREFVDGTAKDLLAVPVARWMILLAKFIVVMIWSLLLTLLIYIVALLLGAWVGLPPASPSIIMQGTRTLAITICLVMGVMTPVAFFASIGRGYLAPVGVTILLVLFANVLAVAGWGEYFPWSIPGLYAGAGQDSPITLSAASYWIVLLTGLAGIMATMLWWNLADQSK